MTILKESATFAICIGLVVLGACFIFGIDPETAVRLILFFMLVPFVVAAILQYKVVVAVAQAKVEQLFNRDLNPSTSLRVNRSGAIGDVAAGHVLGRAEREIHHPKPHNVRLVTVHLQSSNHFAVETKLDDDETMRLIPAATPPRLLNGMVDERDLDTFVAGLVIKSHARSDWKGLKMPSGRIVDSDYHAAMVDCLERVGAVIGRKKGAAGVLTMKPPEIAQRLGLPSARREAAKLQLSELA